MEVKMSTLVIATAAVGTRRKKVMRAVSQEKFGGPQVLHVVEMDRPVPIPSEVLVRIRAAALNPVDAMIRSGAFPLFGLPPFVLGWDISGVVENVVPGVTRFKIGDEVFGLPFFPRAAGGYAEYVSAPSRQLSMKPTSLDHVHAAALPLAGLTAWQGLVDAANIQTGERILIHAGAGGVGHIAVQIAKAKGAHVIATASASKRELLLDLGVDEVIDYKEMDFADVVRNVDLVLDTVGGEYGERSLRSLRRGGLLLTVVDRQNADLKLKTETDGKRFVGLTVEPDYVGLEKLSELVDTEKLRPRVDSTFSLADVARAHEVLDAGHAAGKIVLEI
jgi:NADPH:quinone reductase-like Zn-dependent oxidoreductase